MRKMPSNNDAQQQVHTFVTSVLDDLNSLIIVCPEMTPNSLQPIQDAGVLMGIREIMSPFLSLLHCVTVKSRVGP